MPIARRLHHRQINPSWVGVRSPDYDAQPDYAAQEEEYESAAHRALMARERLYATLLGGFAGALGGAAMLLVAGALMMRMGGGADPAASLGGRLHLSGAPPQVVGLALAVAAGSVIGAILGRTTWRVTRVAPRILFFSILVPVV